MSANRSVYNLDRHLQPREQEALFLLAEGWPLKDIAFRMRLSHATVKLYLHSAYLSLGFDQLLPERTCRALAVRWAMARRLNLPLSTAPTRRARLLEDCCLPPE